MEISRSVIDRYTSSINGIGDEAKRIMLDALSKIDLESDNAIDLVKAVFAEAMPGFAEQSAYLAARFYDGMRELQLGEALGAEVLTGGSMTQTDIAIDGIFASTAKPDAIMSKLEQRIGYEVARAAGECVYRNGLRDTANVRFARVPSGSETCNWCIMLASRGFVYHSKAAAGELNHYHSDCDCRVVPSFEKSAKVEGYDIKSLYTKWKDSGFVPPKKAKKDD